MLFVPVSGRFGMGEFARSSAIARAVQLRWPAADVRFVLSREAPYAAEFPVTLLPASPTFHSAELIELIHTWRPHVVVFDNAGRTAQLRAAHRSGARVVYISARRRQRRKAFRLRWMRLIDEHWIAYPEFIAGGLTLVERLKVRLLRRPTVRYLDVILASARPSRGGDGAAAGSQEAGESVLVVPGGGTGHPGAEDATGQFLGAARALARDGFAVRYVGPAGAGAGTGATEARSPHLLLLGSIPQAELAQLMRDARLVVVNGGSTLLQAIACGAPCVAVPIAGDQRERIRRCVAAGVAVEAPLAAAEIVSTSLGLLRDEALRAELMKRARGLALADGVAVALSALGPYLEAF